MVQFGSGESCGIVCGVGKGVDEERERERTFSTRDGCYIHISFPQLTLYVLTVAVVK